MEKRKLTGTDGKSQATIEGELERGDGLEGYEYGSDLSVDPTPLIDSGTGKTVTIRTFEFKMNPEMAKEFPEDKQTIFNLHAKQIATILWGDGLKPLETESPRVIVKKKEGKYFIFVPCEAKISTTFADKPRSLSEQLNQNESTGH